MRGHPWLADSRRIGTGTLRVLGMSVYEASLFALDNFDAAAFAAHPLVLEIHYRRALTGSAIADFSLAEMRRLAGNASLDEGSAERWGQFMRRAFPDVRSGDRITGHWSPASGTTRFATNEGAPLELVDAGFGPRFFGIWLAAQTSRPQLREQLLGSKAPT
ncbi:MAG: chalcone isomerase family protein [Rubrivivax sp.]|nr:chalcone isomerase family protein [Rubrivivax sp.]